VQKLDRLNSAVGKKFSVKGAAINGRALTQESLLHFALSTGNLDLIYFDEHYARRSKRGRLLPPPTWYTAIIDPHIGAQAMYTAVARNAVEYLGEAPLPPDEGDSGPPYHYLDNLRSFNGAMGFRPVCEPELGDTFLLVGTVSEVAAKESQKFGEFAIVRGELEYLNAQGVTLAKGYGSSIVYDLARVTDSRSTRARSSGSLAGSAAGTGRAMSPVDAIAGVRRRGGEPRYWDDIEVGQSIEPLFKGTLDPAEVAVYSVKHGVSRLADRKIEEAWRLLASGEGIAAARLYRQIAADPGFGFGVARHLNASDAEAEGAPGAYDIGTQRAAWAAQAVTDWMGDEGQVTAFDLEIRGFLVVGDSAWCKGTVASKYIQDGRHLVRLHIWVENQKGDRVSRGVAEVCLPSR
jgi:acyl dehydratase